jgi:inosine-uridine nucleoside N-ribohydrolase
MYANPTAARNVLLSQATKTLVPLDASSKTVLTFERFDQMTAEAAPNSQAASLLHRLLPFGFRQYHECLGIEGFPLNAVTALAAAVRPDLLKTRGMTVDVEVEGILTRGATVFDKRRTTRGRPNIEVVTDVDPAGILAYFHALVRRALSESR